MAITDRAISPPTADVVVVGMPDVTLLLVTGPQSQVNCELVEELRASVVACGGGDPVEVVWSS